MKEILQFINTGIFKGISLGKKLEEVKAFLGEPDDSSISKKPIILKYGNTELTFHKINSEYKLSSINIHFDIYTEIISQKDLMSEALAVGIKLEKDKKHCFEGLQVGYKATSNVVVIFNLEEENQPLENIFIYKEPDSLL